MRKIFNLKIVVFVVTFIVIIPIFVSCAPVGRGTKGTGEISDVQDYLSGMVGGKVTDVELIHSVHVNEFIWDNKIIVDAGQSWTTSEKIIPEHDILYFRAYSPDLKSYIFLKFNDRNDTKCYNTLQEYNIEKIEKEKADVKKLLSNIEKVMSNHDIKILDTCYQRDTEEEDLNNIYIHPKDYFSYMQNRFSNSIDYIFESYSSIWILLEINGNLDDIRAAKDSIQGAFEDISAGIHISIMTADGETVNFNGITEPVIEVEPGGTNIFR